VIAGVRRESDGELLRTEGSGRIAPTILDVTDEAQVAALDSTLPEHLDAVVNNAGILITGPVEAMPLDSWRRQLDVNVIGQVAVTQAVLPRLRSSRGRVVFMSSLSGRVATPITGSYNASKFAIEALADALRIEVRPWGIDVSLIEPAQVDTDMWQQAVEAFDSDVEALSAEQRTLYAEHTAGYRRAIPVSQRLAAPPAKVAAAVERALTTRRPRARYVVGAGPKIQSRFAALTPTPVMDFVLRSALRIPRRA
jgi:NAD(P)-dependent dehydrogenase (short-subunit alcohol dehydrogenase family)